MDIFAFRKNTKTRLELDVTGTELKIPATLLCGSRSGKVLTLSAGVHSREYIGIQALIELAAELRPEDIRGTVIILHCCNYEGFIKRSADVVPSDGKNLNREFPGSAEGSVTQRLAAYLEDEIVSRSDYIVDLHSGGFCEELVPHVYFQGTAAPEVRAVSERIARYVDVQYIYSSFAKNGFYSHAGSLGVPGIILERGGCGLVRGEEIAADIADVKNIMRGMGFLSDGTAAVEHEPVVMSSGYFEDAPCSGCWYPTHRAGDYICEGESLGTIRDIYGEALHRFTARCGGIILYQTASLGIESGCPAISYGENGDTYGRESAELLDKAGA